jgi:hypothetical protein
MKVVFGSVEETRNMQVGRINMGAPAKKIVGQMHLWGLFWPLFTQNYKPAVILQFRGIWGSARIALSLECLLFVHKTS